MQIWPAIDLRGGMCVRLQQGDFQRETVFGEDPAKMARHWADLGAEHLHLVDLDGARQGAPTNLVAIEAILQEIEIPCELGGGIRDESTIRDMLALGLDRLVIGTKALKDPDWFRGMCRAFPGKLALGIDARAGMVATEGWLETSQKPAVELAAQFRGEPVGAVIFTDIEADGMLHGPNFTALAEMAQAVDLPVIASGGVSTVRDVVRLAELPVAGCIIGRALYEGALSLTDALAASRIRPDNEEIVH